MFKLEKLRNNKETEEITYAIIYNLTVPYLINPKKFFSFIRNLHSQITAIRNLDINNYSLDFTCYLMYNRMISNISKLFHNIKSEWKVITWCILYIAFIFILDRFTFFFNFISISDEEE